MKRLQVENYVKWDLCYPYVECPLGTFTSQVTIYQSHHVFTTVLMSQFDLKLTRYYFSDMTMNIILLISLN